MKKNSGKSSVSKGAKSSKLKPNINVKVDELFLTWVNLPDQDVLHENLNAIKNHSELSGKSQNEENNNIHTSEESRPVLSPRRLNHTVKNNINRTKSANRRSSDNSTFDESVVKEFNKSQEIKISQNLAAKIPQFYFPKGRPKTLNELGVMKQKIGEIFRNHTKNSITLLDMIPVAEACGCPMYWKSLLFNAAKSTNKDTVTKQDIITMWTNIINENHDESSRFVALLCKPPNIYLEFEDFMPLLRDIVNTHPGLTFLRDAPEFHTRYMNTVIARIFFTVNRSWSGKISVHELKKSNFLEILKTLHNEPDINAITDYFSYEHFYVIYCKFWELDSDHNLVIDRHDLVKHSDGVLSMRLIDRILSGAVTRWEKSKQRGVMSYIDFVWFLISEEDKKLPTSIEYWFRCMDLDGDGVISLYEMEYFYEEQIRKLELLDIEALPFDDCACQMLDMIKPSRPECVSLSDLKRSQMAYLFFDTFLNVEKYLEHEQKDPFANNPFGEDTDEPPMPTQSDWERYAAEEYDNLVAEEQANENRSPDTQSYYEDEADPAIEAELRSLGLIGDDVPTPKYNAGEAALNTKVAV